MSGKAVHFLLVEDDDDHADLITIALLAENGTDNVVDRVRNGTHALEYMHGEGAYRGRPRPQVVLLDIRLKQPTGIDGIGVLTAIKSNLRFRSTPVIVLTASLSPDDISEAYAHHANSYLRKPIDYGEFDRMIRGLARYWGHWNQAPASEGRPARGPPSDEAGFAESAGAGERPATTEEADQPE